MVKRDEANEGNTHKDDMILRTFFGLRIHLRDDCEGPVATESYSAKQQPLKVMWKAIEGTS